MNNFHILKILFISLFTLISCALKRRIGIPYSEIEDALHIKKCNGGKYFETNFSDGCDCKDVLGYGPECDIKKLFNSTHHDVIYLCLQDDSDSWMKNLENQFSKGMIKIIEKTKYYVKGFVGNLFYFNVEYFCSNSHKTIFPWPRLKGKVVEGIFSKKIDLKILSPKEKKRKSNKTCEAKVSKTAFNGDYITWTFQAVILTFLIPCFIKLFLEDIKKIICRSTMNRLRSNDLLGLGEEHEFLEDHSENPNAVMPGTSYYCNRHSKASHEALGLLEMEIQSVEEGAQVPPTK